MEAVAIRTFPPFARQVCKFGAPRVNEHSSDVHIFVGENGTGKTRLLSLLLAACGNPGELRDRVTEAVDAFVVPDDVKSHKVGWSAVAGKCVLFRDEKYAHALETIISTGVTPHQIGLPDHHSSLLNETGKTVAFAFRAVPAIRDEKLKPMVAAEWTNANAFLVFSPTAKENLALTQAIANMKIRTGMYLASNPGGAPDRTIRMTSGLEKAIEIITGRQFIFVVDQEGADMHLKALWGGVRMRLHQLPDGLRVIIGWLAACVAKLDHLLPQIEKPLEHSILLFLDEPEANLHPAWQRRILPGLQALLPNAQIFVATHSPFVVSSVNRGWIYIFQKDSDCEVKIQGPKKCSEGDTYVDVVEDVLGVKEWYDPETESLLSRFRELRNAALQTFSTADIEAMTSLAKDIAHRSNSLEVMMGRELAQFEAKKKLRQVPGESRAQV